MERHLHLVPAGPDLVEKVEDPAVVVDAPEDTNIVDLESERRRRRYRYHPAAGRAWIDELFDEDEDDDDWDPLDPVC
jgi:hypothetical protein